MGTQTGPVLSTSASSGRAFNTWPNISHDIDVFCSLLLSLRHWLHRHPASDIDISVGVTLQTRHNCTVTFLVEHPSVNQTQPERALEYLFPDSEVLIFTSKNLVFILWTK